MIAGISPSAPSPFRAHRPTLLAPGLVLPCGVSESLVLFHPADDLLDSASYPGVLVFWSYCS